MSLNAALASVILLSLVLAVAVRAFEQAVRWLTASYAVLVACALAWCMDSLIGHREFGSPMLPAERQRRIAHLGYYAGSDGAFLFGDRGETKGIPHSSLAEDEWIMLRPRASQSSEIPLWDLEYECHRNPLRVNGDCVNLPEECWLRPGDRLQITFHDGRATRYIAIEWSRVARRFGPFSARADERFTYTQQDEADGSASSIAAPPAIDLSRRFIGDSRDLAALIRSAGDRLAARSWSVNRNWWEILESIGFVRERRDDAAARLGVLAAPGLLARADVEVYVAGRRLPPPAGPKKMDAAAGATVTYGAGQRHALMLRLPPAVARDKEFGIVSELELLHPTSWPLPPDWKQPFLLTSSPSYIPRDGYRVQLADPLAAFYATGKLDGSADAIDINDGKRHENYRVRTGDEGEKIRLGDYRGGAVFALDPLRQAAPYAGRNAMLVLFLATILFAVFAVTDEDEKIHLDLAWAVLWGCSLALLTVRLIVAYRASLLPPPDATYGEIRAVFDRGLILSHNAFIALPFLLLAARSFYRLVTNWGRLESSTLWAGRLWKAIQNNRAAAYGLWVGIVAVYLGVAALFGHNESLGIRVSVAVHIMVVLGIALHARRFVDLEKGSWRERVIFVLLAGGAILGVMIVIGDNGSFVYLISLAACSLIVLLWNAQPRGKVRGWAVPALIVMVPVLIPLAGRIHLPGMRQVVYSRLHGIVLYRIASLTNTESDLLLADAAADRGLSIDKLLRNSHQTWQMLSYAAKGSHDPQGFGSSPLTNRGMTYATSMSDCAFATYVVSEYGRWGATLLAGIYILLGAALLYAGLYLPENAEHRLIPLAAIAGFFACNALYMASANAGIAPFTGQNVPFLSLHSPSDIVQCGFLLILGVLLISWDVRSCTRLQAQDHPMVRRAAWAFLAALLVWDGVLFWQLTRLGSDSTYAQDFNLSRDVFDSIERDLPQADRNVSWRLEPRTLNLVRSSVGDVSVIEREFVRQFNDRPDKENRAGGPLFLERSGAGGYRIRVNRTYWRMRSPFAQDAVWDGTIFAAGRDPQPTISLLGGSVEIALAAEGPAGTLSLDRAPPQHVTYRAVTIQESGQDLFELYNGPRGLFVAGKDSKDCRLYVGGTPLARAHELKPLDLVVFEYGGKRRSFIYLGMQQAGLSHVNWINGKRERVLLETEWFPMTWSIAKAAIAARAARQNPPHDLHLTIDLDLQRQLQAATESYAAGQELYKDNDPLKTRRLAVTIMDAFSGEVVGLGSWPYANPNDPGFEQSLEDASPVEQERLARNHNLVNHNVGSTVKPLVFASVATELWPEVDLGKLTIFNNGSKDPSPAGSDPQPIHLHDRVAGLQLKPPWDCFTQRPSSNADEFLVHSINFYEAGIGMMGMWMNKSDREKAWVANTQPADLSYAGTSYGFDLRRLRGLESPFRLDDPNPQPRTESMKQTLLFRGLADLFDVWIAEDRDPAIAATAERFLPSLSKNLLDASGRLRNDAIRYVVPEPVIFHPETYTDIRNDLISFLIGGGSCQLNDVRMAESAARIATGLRVRATLEKRAAGEIARDKLPSPIGDADWRFNHVIEPLRRVSEEGTAEAMKGFVKEPYTVIYKTGTLSTMGPRESEYILFVLGRRENGQFVPSNTVAGFVWMEESKQTTGDGPDAQKKKFDFAKLLLPPVIQYLDGRSKPK
jgi:cell division protein FtsI/penicillin-binding protein 2/cell division protein FtsW (lipid II flippase)